MNVPLWSMCQLKHVSWKWVMVMRSWVTFETTVEHIWGKLGLQLPASVGGIWRTCDYTETLSSKLWLKKNH